MGVRTIWTFQPTDVERQIVATEWERLERMMPGVRITRSVVLRALIGRGAREANTAVKTDAVRGKTAERPADLSAEALAEAEAARARFRRPGTRK